MLLRTFSWIVMGSMLLILFFPDLHSWKNLSLHVLSSLSLCCRAVPCRAMSCHLNPGMALVFGRSSSKHILALGGCVTVV